MEHLRINNLAQLPQHVKVPDYDVNQVTHGIVHLGATSNFAAANVFPFIDTALGVKAKRGEALDLGVTAVKTTSGALPPHLRKRQDDQDNLYTLIGLNGKEEARVIGAVRKIMNYEDSPAAVIDLMADPRTKIITITGTQAAYVLDKTGKSLDGSNPQVLQDMQSPFRPVTVPGIINAALSRREQNGVAPPMIISCDNLAGNGTKLGNVLTQHAAMSGIVSPEYMARVQTPNTMVDRITPGQDWGKNTERALRHGVADGSAVVTEGKFSKWVIEQPGPAEDIRLGELRAGGVKVVHDLKPHEDMKIRGLNGAHMALALTGLLSGETHVHEAMARPFIRPFITKLLDQAAATVQLPKSETSVLRPEVTGRFDNAEMPDTLSRLVNETSSKVGARLVNYEAIKEGKGYEASAFAVAAWIRFIRGDDKDGNRIAINDKNATDLSNKIMSVGFNVGKFLTQEAGQAVFDVSRLGPELEGHRVAKPFVTLVTKYYNDISANGMQTALARAFGVDDGLAEKQRAAAKQMQGEEPQRPARRLIGGTDPNPGQQG